MFFVLQTPCAAWVVGFQQSPIVFDEIGGELIGYGQSRNSSLQHSFRQNTRISGEGVTDCKTGCIQLQEISTSLHYFFGVICGNRFDGNWGVGTAKVEKSANSIFFYRIGVREVVKKSKWKFKMAFAIRGPTPPP